LPSSVISTISTISIFLFSFAFSEIFRFFLSFFAFYAFSSLMLEILTLKHFFIFLYPFRYKFFPQLECRPPRSSFTDVIQQLTLSMRQHLKIVEEGCDAIDVAVSNFNATLQP